MKNKEHTYLVVYMAQQDGAISYGNTVLSTESTGRALFMDAKYQVINYCNDDNFVIVNVCKLD